MKSTTVVSPKAMAEQSRSVDGRNVILVVCSVAAFISQLDTSVLNVALPAIQRSFRASLASLQWVTDAYVLVLCCLALLFGSIADRYGRKKMFRFGLSIFMLGSILCSVAPSVGFLIAARALQAVGGSMLNANAVAIITNVFVEAKERARALGFWSSVSGLSLAAGPVIGGALVDSLGWRSIFWLNVPIVLSVLWLTKHHVPESKSERPRRFDLPGEILVIFVLSTLTYAIIEAPAIGWTSTRTAATFTACVIGLIAFIAFELRKHEPLLELHLFKSPPFVAAAVVAVLTFVTLAGFLFTNSLYFQDVRGISALGTGVLLLPSMAAFAIMAPISGRLIGRFGVRPSLVLGGISIAAGSLLLAQESRTSGYGTLQLGEVLLGLGFGMTIPPITFTAMAGMPRNQAGVASAMTGMFRSMGTGLGIAVTGSLIATAYRERLVSALALSNVPRASRSQFVHAGIGAGNLAAHASLSRVRVIAPALRDSLADSTHIAWWLALGAGLMLAAFAAAATGPRGRAVAARLLTDT